MRERSKIALKDFEKLNSIGRGGFGKVFEVKSSKSEQRYAMKEMDKTRIYAKRSVESVMNELRILFRVKSDFIVNVNFAFQDKERLYLVMDLMKGGDLRKHHRKIRMFTEDQTRFFIACVMEGLEEIHNKGILHRDIKPENLVFDE